VITKAQAIAAAEDHARKAGRKVDEYRLDSAELNEEDGSPFVGCWLVRFEHEPAMPGGHFAVLVDGRTGAVRHLFPGR
jgi:hypothetical protein